MNFVRAASCIVVGVCLSLSASAATYENIFNSGFANSGSIPDGNLSGWSDSRTISGIAESVITDVTVKLNISGGYNGDLYAYLTFDNVLVPLLNRVGVTTGSSFGYNDSGFNVILTTSAANDIHFYRDQTVPAPSSPITGTWQPDGRTISPLSAPSLFAGASRTTLASYNGKNPNGTWTLFLADVSGGSISQVQQWELDITAVPEPAQVAMGIFGGILLTVGIVRKIRNRQGMERA